MPLIHEKSEVETPSVLTALRAFFRRFDPLQIIPILILFTIGVFFVYGIGQQAGGIAAEVFWKRQIQWFGCGAVLWFVLTMLDYRKFGLSSAICYLPGVLTLLYVLINGVGRFGAKRWISVFGTSIQPSEIVKLIVIVLSSWILSNRPGGEPGGRNWRKVVPVVLLTGVPVFLILKQPNLSTALTLVFAIAAIVFAAGLKIRWILALIVILSLSAPLTYTMLRPYHRERIKVFLDPGLDPLNKGWNQLQAEMAVGSGGFSGKGFMQGTQSTLGYLPQTVSNSDFIFSVIAEETGFLGALVLVSMYVLLILSVFRTAMAAPDSFGRYLCTGIGVLLATHSIVNIGVSIRLMPVTGLPLPLVSYGGTFMLVSMSALGIVQSVYAQRSKTITE